ncbi:unnamed protein product [Linum trigynum]|uniref:Uncharacterized protein n=1 Tax=Linum trigynum TaxID=586398 RepID=A0AAV2D260_9ROSI
MEEATSRGGGGGESSPSRVELEAEETSIVSGRKPTEDAIKSTSCGGSVPDSPPPSNADLEFPIAPVSAP